jgi:arylformamidase
MKIYDITRRLSGDVVVYPGDRVPRVTREDRGDYLISELVLSSHSGTHVDAPLHYLKAGMTVDTIPLEWLIGPVQVIDCSAGTGLIGREELAALAPGMTRVLIRTSFSGMETFSSGFRGLSIDAAAYLADSGVRCIGTDTPSIEAYGGDGSLHRFLFAHDMVVIELLALAGVPAGGYFMVALPLRLQDGDGAPARVVLLDHGSFGGEGI